MRVAGDQRLVVSKTHRLGMFKQIVTVAYLHVILFATHEKDTALKA